VLVYHLVSHIQDGGQYPEVVMNLAINPNIFVVQNPKQAYAPGHTHTAQTVGDSNIQR